MDPVKFAAIARDCALVLETGKAMLEGYDDRPLADQATGIWFNGVGKDSYETFVVLPDDTGFRFCKTAYRPYDAYVTACLVVLKHYLGDGIKLSSDGGAGEWLDGMMLCRRVLGYETRDFKSVLADLG